jgi:alkylation response protein AidB-like acyl-CoA dehydrogenase
MAAVGRLDAAESVARDVLAPAADRIEDDPGLLDSCLAALAGAGLYDVVLSDEPLLMERTVEALACGCLTVALVWMQHHGAVVGVAGSDRGRLRAEWLSPLLNGAVRATTTFAGVLPAPLLRVEFRDGHHVLNGEAPWISGWSTAGVVNVSARDPSDRILWLLVDTCPTEALTVEPVELMALNASHTVHAQCRELVVPDDRLVGSVSVDEWRATDVNRLRINGYLALGLARRCALSARDAGLDAAVDRCRSALDAATSVDVAAVRALAGRLALQAAAAALVAGGSQEVIRGRAAERLAREALVLLVFGTRPAIRASLLEGLSRFG